jgi:hypothetical protein
MPLLSCICALNFPIGATAKPRVVQRDHFTLASTRIPRFDRRPKPVDIVIVLFGRPKGFGVGRKCSASTIRSDREDQLTLIRRNATVTRASKRSKDRPRQGRFNSPRRGPAPSHRGANWKMYTWPAPRSELHPISAGSISAHPHALQFWGNSNGDVVGPRPFHFAGNVLPWPVARAAKLFHIPRFISQNFAAIMWPNLPQWRLATLVWLDGRTIKTL